MNAGAATWRAVRAAAVTVLVAAYPFLLLTGLDHASARTLGAVLLAAVLAAALLAGGAGRLLPLLVRRFGLLVAVAVAAAATNHPLALTLLPSFTSLWLLATFGRSLWRGPNMVFQFASAAHGGFPDFLVPYCRKVTWMWCGFFVVNAAVATVLAFGADASTWAFYTGFFSYLLVAGLATAEYLFHKSRFRFYEDRWPDSVLRRIWPPEDTPLGRRTLAWQVARRGGHRDGGSR